MMMKNQAEKLGTPSQAQFPQAPTQLTSKGVKAIEEFNREKAGAPFASLKGSEDLAAALASLLLLWGGRRDAHVVEEAKFAVEQFLKAYPEITIQPKGSSK